MKSNQAGAKSVSFLVVLSLLIAPVFAGLVAEFDGIDIIGNRATSSGSFKVRVSYEVYDGGAGYNPLGQTDEYQVAFTLTHLGPDESGEPDVNIGRFSVFTKLTASTDGGPNYDYTGAFVDADYANQTPSIGGIAPSDPIDPAVETFSDKVQYKFYDDYYDPKFAEGNISQLLVMTFDPTQMPLTDVLIEINGTAGQNIEGFGRINKIPAKFCLHFLRTLVQY